MFSDKFYIIKIIEMKTKNLQNKQKIITAKLQEVKGINELKKIYSSVEDQHKVLRQDVLQLNYKVDILKRKHNNQPTSLTQQEQNKARQIKQVKKELKQNYKLMQQLKKRIQSLQKENMMQQDVANQSVKLQNSLKKTLAQISESKKAISDLQNETERLQKTISLQQEESTRHKPKIDQFEQNNTKLRKKILSLRKLQTEKQYQSLKIMDSIYSVKQRYNKNQQIFIQIEKEKLSLVKTKKQTKKNISQEVNIKSLEADVQSLKMAVRKSQNQYLKNEGSKLKLKQRLQNKSKQDLIYLKQLQSKSVKMSQELNRLKAMWKHHLQVIQKNKQRQQNINEEIMVQPYQQAYSQKKPQLRRDYAGVLGGKYSFDDRQALKQNKKPFIVGFYAYQYQHIGTAKNLLVGIRAIYDDSAANQLNDLPLPGQYLSKCKMSKFTLNQGDFVKLFKVKYHTLENRILKMEVRTNKNSKFEFGDKRSFNDVTVGQNVYGFDISIHEYPVSLFGSFNIIRSQWYMESFGVQINDL